MGQVANVITTLSYGEALGALLAGGCPQEDLLIVAAQSAVETAAWQKMRNWNFGNLTPSQAQLAAGIDWMNQGLNMRYIAYPDPVSGAAAMVSWLSSRGILAVAGNIDSYMSRLQSTCYLGCIGLTDGTGHTVTDQDYANYRAGIVTWMNKLSGVTPVPPPSVSSTHPVLVAGVVAGSAAVALLGWSLYTRQHPLDVIADLLP